MTITEYPIKRLSRTFLKVLTAFLLLFLCQSCFTGIESTPKITYKDVRKEQIEVTPEQEFAKGFVATAFADWEIGRRFKTVDAKASLSYLPMPGKTANLAEGDIIEYLGVREVRSIVGGNTAELLFRKIADTDTLTYRPGADIVELQERGVLHLPFVVDLATVSDASQQLLGRELYTRTERWLSPTGGSVRGRKFVKVRVTSVDAGNETYPYLISFVSEEKDGESGALMMATNVTDDTPALRGFENLFYLSNPKDKYPLISDSNWELIRNCKVAEGMTSQEATLALGTPSDVIRRPDQSMLYERWSYPGGIYLIFEDGILVRFNQ
jgi:hypothetical protein